MFTGNLLPRFADRFGTLRVCKLWGSRASSQFTVLGFRVWSFRLVGFRASPTRPYTETLQRHDCATSLKWIEPVRGVVS